MRISDWSADVCSSDLDGSDRWCGLSCDQTGMTGKGEVVPGQVQTDDQAVAKVGQEKDMNRRPDEPRDYASQPQPAEIDNCVAPSDRRKTAVVTVAKRSHRAASDPGHDRKCRMAALPFRHRRYSRQRPLIGPGAMRHIAPYQPD